MRFSHFSLKLSMDKPAPAAYRAATKEVGLLKSS
jgi:hypothetical protein